MPYTKDETWEKLAAHPGWRLEDDGQLHADFTFEDFAHALMFVGAVGHLAETANHHPDILIYSYKHVRLSMMSHDVEGITDRDFDLIAQIETLPGCTPDVGN